MYPLTPRVATAARRPAAAVLVVATLFGSFALPLVSAPAPARAEKFPEPSIYPVSWELKFTHGLPKRIVVAVPGDPHPKAFWYMTYTVTNEGTKPVEFLPEFNMLSDDGKVTRSDKAIPPQVFDEVKRREGAKLLEASRKIEGPVQTGEDQARDGVAIWPEPIARMATFSIFAAGLSGEYVTLKKGADGKYVPVDPRKAGEELKGVDEKDLMTLRKTLQLTYHINGDEVRPGDDEVHTRGEQWIMR